MARRLPQGQARAVIPSTRNPEFTLAELRERTQIPVTKIVVDGSLSRSQLHGHCNRIIKKARKEAKQFVWNKPVLPQENSPASIDLVMGDVDSEIVKLCFEMKSLYCKGVLVREHFYELRTSEDPVSFVEGNIPLGYKESYDKMLQSTNPRVDLRPEDFLIAYQWFLRLRNDHIVGYDMAARCIELISLMLLESSRQRYMMERICYGPPRPIVYFKMDGAAWQSVHTWGYRSKRAKGIDYENNETVVEREHPEKRQTAIEELNIINSTKPLPVKAWDKSQRQIFFFHMPSDEKA